MTTNRSAPTATVVHVLVDEDVEAAIDWLCGAFGFVERQYTAEDPGGRRRTFSQHVADVAPAEWGAKEPATPRR